MAIKITTPKNGQKMQIWQIPEANEKNILQWCFETSEKAYVVKLQKGILSVFELLPNASGDDWVYTSIDADSISEEVTLFIA